MTQVPRFRVCKTFTVESGHMLSKHEGRCRFPHGHTRKIEIVVSSPTLDEHDMVIDFKALKFIVEPIVQQFDHSMALNREDPLLEPMSNVYPDSVLIFDQDPTTEVLAKYIFENVQQILGSGFEQTIEGVMYRLDANRCQLERVRVWETPTSWAEYLI